MTVSADTPPSEPVRQLVLAHEVLRIVGFPADDIFAAFSPTQPDGLRAACCILRTQGREWTWVLVPAGNTSDEAFRAEWEEAVAVWNTEHPTTPLWGIEGFARHWLPLVVDSLVRKGIRLPREARAS